MNSGCKKHAYTYFRIKHFDMSVTELEGRKDGTKGHWPTHARHSPITEIGFHPSNNIVASGNKFGHLSLSSPLGKQEPELHDKDQCSES